MHGYSPKFELVSFPRPIDPPDDYSDWYYVVNDDLHLIHTTDGKGIAKIKHETLPMTPENVIFIPPHTEYNVIPDTHLGMNMINYHFHLRLDEHIGIADVLTLPLSFRPPDIANILSDLLGWHEDWMGDTPFARAAATANLFQLTIRYYSEYGQPAASSTAADPLMERLSRFLAEHPRDSYDAPSLARMLGLSVSQMNRRFRQVYSQSPKQYWLRRRFHRARSMLQESADSIATVAARMGFEDANYFSRWYKQVSGTSPLHHRRQMRSRVSL